MQLVGIKHFVEIKTVFFLKLFFEFVPVNICKNFLKSYETYHNYCFRIEYWQLHIFLI